MTSVYPLDDLAADSAVRVETDVPRTAFNVDGVRVPADVPADVPRAVAP